jgi:hypothetical protein
MLRIRMYSVAIPPMVHQRVAIARGTRRLTMRLSRFTIKVLATTIEIALAAVTALRYALWWVPLPPAWPNYRRVLRR